MTMGVYVIWGNGKGNFEGKDDLQAKLVQYVGQGHEANLWVWRLWQVEEKMRARRSKLLGPALPSLLCI